MLIKDVHMTYNSTIGEILSYFSGSKTIGEVVSDLFLLDDEVYNFSDAEEVQLEECLVILARCAE